MTSVSNILAIVAALGATPAKLSNTPSVTTELPTQLSSPQPTPTTRFTLANGLKVIIQPSRQVPIVTAVVVYNVGSKDEKPGQYGYAHLFEHLMLDGSAHWPENSVKVLNDLGASQINATTTQDRTIFYETVPRAALERTLFMEADRMGYLAEALTPPKVAREVSVVLNEKRQRGGAPYGEDWIGIAEDMYPADHPYHHSVIGNETDLRAMTVKDATDWFQTYYGPANATLILTGDVASDEARALVEKYFGALAPRAPLNRLSTRVSPVPGTFRRERFEAVPQARIYATYTAPPAGTPDIANLDLIAQIMANGATARLNRRLVAELGTGSTAMVTFDERLLSSEMGFVVIVESPDKVRRAEIALDDEIGRFVTEGPTSDELERARTARLRYIRSSDESTFGKAFLLMRGASLTEDPDYIATYTRQLTDATPESVRRTAQAIYGRPGYRLIVRPMPGTKAVAGGYVLAKGPPPMGAVDAITFPAVERTQLANGLEVVLVPRPATARISMRMRFNSGTASARGPVDRMAVEMLVDETGQKESRAEELGGRLSSVASADTSDVTLSVDAKDIPAGLALLGDVVVRPDLTEARLSAVRKAERGPVEREVNGVPSYRRILNSAVFGVAHPYGANPDPAADLRAIDAVDLDAITAWSRNHIRPERARLYVAGNTTMAALRPVLAAAFGGWAGQGAAVADAGIPAASPAPAPQIIVIDKPGADQSFIAGGRAITPTHPNDDLAIDGANEVYGFATGARIRTTLRDQKGWTYGIGSGFSDARGPRLFTIAGSVDGAHTGDTLAELIREMHAMNGDDPPRQAELDRVANARINQLASRLESNDSLIELIADSETYGNPYDAVVGDPAKLRALTVDQVRRAAGELLAPSRMHWVVVGDWAKVRPQIEGLGLGTPTVISARRQ
ncbi:pitrilysin family protein [Sphingomonas sp. PP-CE-3G-477]|uniref:M16 family metallopeptidase n=1 Tax=Sphingomonas sp. PP-CE-3G-477 TaxID=2135660 RepID=UPI002159253E|nr:pitrilysin family protein [Sphingomonas sp. PP-CE-3G-477]